MIPPDTKLTPLSLGLPAWNTLTAEQQRVYARMMEVYAGYLEQTDYNIGRVIEAIRQTGQLDNTLVIYIAGDNGAMAEGSPQGLLNEMTFFNGVPEDLNEVLKRVDDGTWKTYNHDRPPGHTEVYSVPVDQADRQPLGEHAESWSSPGRRGSQPRESCGRSGTIVSTSCRRYSRCAA